LIDSIIARLALAHRREWRPRPDRRSAEKANLHQACPERSNDQQVQARDWGRVAHAHRPAPRDQGECLAPGPKPHAGVRTLELHSRRLIRCGVESATSILMIVAAWFRQDFLRGPDTAAACVDMESLLAKSSKNPIVLNCLRVSVCELEALHILRRPHLHRSCLCILIDRAGETRSLAPFKVLREARRSGRTN